MLMLNFLELINTPNSFLLFEGAAFITKIYTIGLLFKQRLRYSSAYKAWLLFMSILLCSLFYSFMWVIKLVSMTYMLSLNYQLVLFVIRLSWAFCIFQNLSTIFFLKNLTERQYKLTVYDKIIIIFSSIIIIYFLALAFFDFSILTVQARYAYMATDPLESRIMNYSSNFCLISTAIYIYLIVQNLRHAVLPKILKSQLKIFALFFILPYSISTAIANIQILSHVEIIIGKYLEQYYYFILESLSTILFTCGLLYCTRKVMGLRFLNFKQHVQSNNKFSFINDFTHVLEQLSMATDIHELEHITQRFFKEAFDIPINKIMLYIRRIDEPRDDDQEFDLIEMTMEQFISTKESDPAIIEFIKTNKVLIKDELEFSNFYEENASQEILLQLLDTISADILIPIYEKRIITSYIIVERDARPHELYNDVEHSEMLVLARYLGNIINLMQNRNLHSIIEQERKMRQELYHKHLEINQYKESLRSFLHSTKERKIGVMFYRNRRFSFGNQAAQDLVKININTQVGHPLAQALKHATRSVEEFKAPTTLITRDLKGKKLVLSAIPSLEQTHVIITLYYPEIADLIAKQIDLLKDPSDWDYLLYLETTQSGKLINQLVPAHTTTLLNVKIHLLKLALGSKAVLLNMPEKDLLPTVEILHHIALGQNIHILDLIKPCTTFDVAIQLFGINPIFDARKQTALLEQLSNNGTLFIKNIHLLDTETQEYLAEYIRYGFYRIFKSDKKVASRARIICSSQVNLEELVIEGKFSKELFEELKTTTLIFPSLTSLSEQDIQELTKGYTEQAMISQTFKNLLELTNRERERILTKRPISLQDLKEQIQKLLTNKSEKNNLLQENNFDPSFGIADPKLAEAYRLGKTALRYPEIMAMLWKKFKSQNRIAAFLGVNRSSVNRRCRDYKLYET